jgi:hypothetical protein
MLLPLNLGVEAIMRTQRVDLANRVQIAIYSQYASLEVRLVKIARDSIKIESIRPIPPG